MPLHSRFGPVDGMRRSIQDEIDDGITIRAAHVRRRETKTTVVKVDYVEGLATNVLRDISPTRIELRELKRRYDGTFIKDFVSEGDGRYALYPDRLGVPEMAVQPRGTAVEASRALGDATRGSRASEASRKR
jgi:hypothetical protein